MFNKRGIIYLCLIVMAIFAGGFWYWENYAIQMTPVVPVKAVQVHLAGSSKQVLKNIVVKAVYFVPLDEQVEDEKIFKQQLEDLLNQNAKFYEQQLNNSVKITWEIFPSAVIGLASSTVYDGGDTSRGNPHALVAVEKELNTRFKTGDLSASNFFQEKPGTYQTLAIWYEGLGASGNVILPEPGLDVSSQMLELPDDAPPAFLVSRYFATSASYKDYAGSIFAHEFAHVLGLKDDYDLSTGQALSDDIMGSGRFRPLEYGFLSLENKKLLGLHY